MRAWRAFKKSFLLLSVYVDKIAMGNMGVKQAETSNVWVWERTLAARLLLPCWHVYLLVYDVVYVVLPHLVNFHNFS